VALPEILRTSFLVHDTAPGGVWAVDEATLGFLWDRVPDGGRTLETGSGMSTVLFALKRTQHTCIVPSESEPARIVDHCRQAGVSSDGITFVVEPSERALPRLERRDLDLVLIDGRHGFPAPMIDWFYTAPMLRVGGLLLLDDTQLWPVRLVRDVLGAEPEWALEAQLPRTAVFRKVAEGSEAKEWTAQRHVLAETAALARSDRARQQHDTAVDLLRHGRFLAIAGAVGRELVARVTARRQRTPG
jgi:hypothetical protein